MESSTKLPTGGLVRLHINSTYTPVFCYREFSINSHGIWSQANTLSALLPNLMMQLIVVVTLSRSVQLILRPFHQPRIISDILGGLIVGPSFLGRFELFSEVLFPKRSMVVTDIIAKFAMMFLMFLVGMKMNISMITKGKKQLALGLIGYFVPFYTVFSICFFFSDLLSEVITPGLFFFVFSGSLSLSPFANIFPIVKELRLLNSELGRLSMSAAMTNDVMGWINLILLEVAKQYNVNPGKLVWYFISLGVVIFITVFFARPIVLHIIRKTPEGKPVRSCYIKLILLLVLVMAFLSDAAGASIVEGPLLLGLVIPDGPPLGSAVADKVETMFFNFLLPFFFSSVGVNTNLFPSDNNSKPWTMVAMVIVAAQSTKLIGIIVPSLYLKMPIKDSIAFGLIMNCRGIMDVLTFFHWHQYKVVNDIAHAVLILSTVVTTAITGPVVHWLVKGSKRYKAYNRRTIQHLKRNTELRMVTCIHTQENVPGILDLVQLSYPTQDNPICIYMFHLIELQGRAAPFLIAHKKDCGSSKTSKSSQIIAAFDNLEQQGNGWITVQPYTAICPFSTMHDDICSLSLEKRVSLIILPYHKQRAIDGNMSIFDRAYHIINPNVLAEAPCSVGILIDRKLLGNRIPVVSTEICITHRVCAIFFGGADDREALCFAIRMADNPQVNLIVVRIISQTDMQMSDHRECQADDEVVDDFRLLTVNNHNVSYREESVADAEEVVKFFRSWDTELDLMIVGRKQPDSATVVKELSMWSENPELGPVGDLLSSSEFFHGMVSVLVIQQQTLPGADALGVDRFPRHRQDPYYKSDIP